MTALGLASGRGTREGMARPARVPPLLSGQPGRKEQLRPELPEAQDGDPPPSPKSSPARPGRLGPHVAWGAEEGPHARTGTGAWTPPRSTPPSWGRGSEHPARPQPAASGPRTHPRHAARSETREPGRPAVPGAALGLPGAVPQVRSTPARGSRAGQRQPSAARPLEEVRRPARPPPGRRRGPRVRAPPAPAPQGTPEPGPGRHSLSPTTAFSPEGAIFPKGRRRFRVCQRWGRGLAHHPRGPRPARPRPSRPRPAGEEGGGCAQTAAALPGPLRARDVPRSLPPPSRQHKRPQVRAEPTGRRPQVLRTAGALVAHTRRG